MLAVVVVSQDLEGCHIGFRTNARCVLFKNKWLNALLVPMWNSLQEIIPSLCQASNRAISQIPTGSPCATCTHKSVDLGHWSNTDIRRGTGQDISDLLLKLLGTNNFNNYNEDPSLGVELAHQSVDLSNIIWLWPPTVKNSMQPRILCVGGGGLALTSISMVSLVSKGRSETSLCPGTVAGGAIPSMAAWQTFFYWGFAFTSGISTNKHSNSHHWKGHTSKGHPYCFESDFYLFK